MTIYDPDDQEVWADWNSDEDADDAPTIRPREPTAPRGPNITAAEREAHLHELLAELRGMAVNGRMPTTQTYNRLKRPGMISASMATRRHKCDWAGLARLAGLTYTRAAWGSKKGGTRRKVSA